MNKIKEDIIVSLTTWKPRIQNLPIVLDSIYAQTIQPNKVVLNLGFEEVIPENIQTYIDNHQIEVNYVLDTKVYKKFLPTLLKYPNACVINIDDDCIYPNTMIADFMDLHVQFPQYPISGNHVVYNGLQCHCGCASMTKLSYFGDWLNRIDEELMNKCPSSDIVFTYLAVLNGHPYIHTKREYFTNVVQNSLGNNSYSEQIIQQQGDGVVNSYRYLQERFGNYQNVMNYYVGEGYMADFLIDIIQEMQKNVDRKITEAIECAEQKVRLSYAYRLGKFILNPFKKIKQLFKL